jgi:hypothetical protein
MVEVIFWEIIVGVLYYPNGDRFEGNWVENKPDGKGKVEWYKIGIDYDANGDAIESEWRNGKKLEG